MISVILYGRNDSHGYNLPKRAAISLNCIAEVLSDPDDEILFVDFNTPDDLPTYIEAVYDTLTPAAKSRLRVLRARPHQVPIVKQSHLSALDPLSRNIAIRRSNPRNRWLLFTNSDMIFLPREGVSDLTAAVRDLPDGLYTLPRFELPEPLWESFPRSDPAAILQACRHLGPALHVDEITLALTANRFDQPGDFQLAPRQAMWAIHGFEERMIHGWHHDSNVCKRLYLFYGNRTESLAHRLKGYHCDHTRVATPIHWMGRKMENDLQQYVFGVTDPIAHHQADTWGAPDETIEEVDFADSPAARFIGALERTLGGPQRGDTVADSNDLRNFVSYNEKHVLAQLAGNFTVYPRNARFVYAGNNPRMLALATQCVAELGFTEPLAYVACLLSAGDAPAIARPITSANLPKGCSLEEFLLTNFDAPVFDFGLDQTGLNLGKVERVTDWPRDLRHSLGTVARFLERCVERSDALRGPTPEFIVINANHHLFRRYTDQFLLASDTPFATHVRKGRPRVGDDRLYGSAKWQYTEDGMRSFFGYDNEDYSVQPVTAGDTIDFTSEGHSARYKDGHWGVMDFSGTWTDGHRAALLFEPPSGEADLLAFVRVTEAFIGPEGDPMHVEVLLEGEPLTRWTFLSRYEISVCKAIMPARLMAGKSTCRLEFHVENPQSAERAAIAEGQQVIGEDPREMGIKIQRVEFTSKDRLRYSLGTTLDFMDAGNSIAFAGDLMGVEWAQSESYGPWTVGTKAALKVLFEEPPGPKSIPAAFVISDCMVCRRAPKLPVVVKANGRVVAEWTLDDRNPHTRSINLPPEVFAGGPELTLTFEIPEPHSPASFGWNADDRPLGFRLARAVIGRGDIELLEFGKLPPRRGMIRRVLGLPQFAAHAARILIERYL
jgi:acyl dehydratase